MRGWGMVCGALMLAGLAQINSGDFPVPHPVQFGLLYAGIGLTAWG